MSRCWIVINLTIQEDSSCVQTGCCHSTYCGWLRNPAPVARWFIYVYPIIIPLFAVFHRNPNSYPAGVRNLHQRSVLRTSPERCTSCLKHGRWCPHRRGPGGATSAAHCWDSGACYMCWSCPLNCLVRIMQEFNISFNVTSNQGC